MNLSVGRPAAAARAAGLAAAAVGLEWARVLALRTPVPPVPTLLLGGALLGLLALGWRPSELGLARPQSIRGPGRRSLSRRIFGAHAPHPTPRNPHPTTAISWGPRDLAARLLRSSLTYQRIGSLRSSAPDHDLGHLDTESLAVSATVALAERVLGGLALAAVLLLPAAVRWDGGPLLGPGFGLAAVAVSVGEEVAFRGALFAALEQGFGPAAAIAGSTTAWTLAHSLSHPPAFLPAVAAAGLLLAAWRWAVRDLVGPIIGHVLADLAL